MEGQSRTRLLRVLSPPARMNRISQRVRWELERLHHHFYNNRRKFAGRNRPSRPQGSRKADDSVLGAVDCSPQHEGEDIDMHSPYNKIPFRYHSVLYASQPRALDLEAMDSPSTGRGRLAEAALMGDRAADPALAPQSASRLECVSAPALHLKRSAAAVVRSQAPTVTKLSCPDTFFACTQVVTKLLRCRTEARDR